MKNKNILKITVLFISASLLAFCISGCNGDKTNSYDETTEEESKPLIYDLEGNIVTLPPEPFETVAPAHNSQLGVLADGWLKIVSIGERSGKICVVVENISDKNVEYAVLTVSADSQKLSFNISALMAGQKAVLYCNEDHTYNADTYYVNWEIADKILYDGVPSVHNDIFKVTAEDGSVSVKNISGKDIEGDIAVYYKTLDNGVPVGNITHRIRLSGLPANSTSVINADFAEKDSIELVFIEYDS